MACMGDKGPHSPGVEIATRITIILARKHSVCVLEVKGSRGHWAATNSQNDVNHKVPSCYHTVRCGSPRSHEKHYGLEFVDFLALVILLAMYILVSFFQTGAKGLVSSIGAFYFFLLFFSLLNFNLLYLLSMFLFFLWIWFPQFWKGNQ